MVLYPEYELEFREVDGHVPQRCIDEARQLVSQLQHHGLEDERFIVVTSEHIPGWLQLDFMYVSLFVEFQWIDGSTPRIEYTIQDTRRDLLYRYQPADLLDELLRILVRCGELPQHARVAP